MKTNSQSNRDFTKTVWKEREERKGGGGLLLCLSHIGICGAEGRVSKPFSLEVGVWHA